MTTTRATPSPPPDSMTTFLSFQDTSLEHDFWAREKAGRLRLIEIGSLALSLAITAATILLGPPSSGPMSESLAMYTRLSGYIYGAVMGAVLYLAVSSRLCYERYHDWIMIFLRLAAYPELVLYLDSPCGRLKNVLGYTYYSPIVQDSLNGFTEYSLQSVISEPTWAGEGCAATWEDESRVNWGVLVFWAVVLFGPIKLFLDGLRFPLRFRHHVFVQIGVIVLLCFWNVRICESCFSEKASQESIFLACQWTTLGTTGIWLDCTLAGFPMACFTFTLQMHVLLGLLASSYIVYKHEIALRMGGTLQLWPYQ